jgi:hypothetical protein
VNLTTEIYISIHPFKFFINFGQNTKKYLMSIDHYGVPRRLAPWWGTKMLLAAPTIPLKETPEGGMTFLKY